MLTPPFHVISDTHFFHDNIVKYCGRDERIEALIGPDKAKRIDHNEYMVQKWNEVVKPNDTVLHLGDIYSKRAKERYRDTIAPRLNGNIIAILGNHDVEDHDWEAAGITVVGPFGMSYRGVNLTFDHYPVDGIHHKTNRLHVHGHIHNNGYPSDGRYDNQANMSVEVNDFQPVQLDSIVEGFLASR